MVESGHRSELTRVDAGRIVHRNERVGVGWVAHHQHLDVLLGILGDCLTLRLEDSTVGREQVLALHAVLTRHCADEQSNVGVTECNVCIIGAHHAVEQRECTVVELHLDARECSERGRYFEELQDDPRIRSEHCTRRDSKDEAVANLSCCAGNGDSYWCCHGGSR